MAAKPLVIILGAGRPFKGDAPSALVSTPTGNRVLDWILDSFSVIEPEFHFVGGYRFEEVAASYPALPMSINPRWRTSGSAGSLLSAPPLAGRDVYVCYSDTVFSRAVVSKLAASEAALSVVVDTAWRNRYENRSDAALISAEKVVVDGGKVRRIGSDIPVADATAEFTGITKLTGDALEELERLRRDGGIPARVRTLPDLLRYLGHDIAAVEIEGDWAELDEPRDLSRFVLGTKADTLTRLRPLLAHGTISEPFSFTVGAWDADRQAIYRTVCSRFASAESLVVRSSALTEDGWAYSNAGKFVSLLGVKLEESHFLGAVEEVIQSYGDRNPDHQVLVQETLTDVALSGVLFTRTLNHGAPYYQINYDDTTASTDAVTSGSGASLRTTIIHRSVVDLLASLVSGTPSGGELDNAVAGVWPSGVDRRLARVVLAARDIEKLVGHDGLDIEFAVTGSGEVNVFQVRPIAVAHEDKASDDEVELAIESAQRYFLELQSRSPFVFGDRTFLGCMPDWNPAEIIGTRPRRLALTLYQYLITNEVWATQRAEYGYRDVRPQPLIVTLGGQPFVDVRATLNSFIPAAVNRNLATRLAEYYVRRLEENPHFHDKIEFDVAVTCATFDFEFESRHLKDAGFSSEELDELRSALVALTSAGVRRCSRDFDSLTLLSDRFDDILRSQPSGLQRAFVLLEDCRRYGTLTFAHLARAGFVAVSFLRSMRRCGLASGEVIERFLNSLNTVTRQLERDGAAVAAGCLGWQEFVNRYGHLRPGTYEITSLAYAEDPDRFLRPLVRSGAVEEEVGESRFPDDVRRALETALKDCGFDFGVDELETFIRTAIIGREYAKFLFSRNLSQALNDIAVFGAHYGLTREQLSHLALQDLQAVREGVGGFTSVADFLRERAAHGAYEHRITQALELPALICDVDDILGFERFATEPNFVTEKKIVGDTVVLGTAAGEVPDLEGRIVLIPQADPGFDWLFGHPIAGLITMYGGANSHMTIRAAEFGLPAAIGVGESIYDQLARAKTIELDCRARRINVVL